MVSAHPPGRGSGTGLRAHVTLSALRERFDAVDVVALANEGEFSLGDPSAFLIPRPEPLRLLGKVAALRYGTDFYADDRRAQLTERMRSLVEERRLRPQYDLVWVCQSLVATAAESVTAQARVLDIDNIAAAERRRLATDLSASPVKRLYRRLSADVLAREERSRASRFDLIVVPSTLERERLGSLPVGVEVVPNTVGPQPQIRVKDTGPRMVFSGSLDYEPNVDAVRWLIGGMFDRIRDAVAEAELVVAGRDPTPEIRSLCGAAGVELVADAPSLDPLYSKARIALAPLRLGGGTRFKVIEAMARGAAVVATETASEGLDVDPGRDLLVATDQAQFVESCVSLLRDPGRAAELGARARETWARGTVPTGRRSRSSRSSSEC